MWVFAGLVCDAAGGFAGGLAGGLALAAAAGLYALVQVAGLKRFDMLHKYMLLFCPPFWGAVIKK